jgi:hypothetical protein
MKKSILSIALVAAIAVAGAWNFAQNQEEVTLSDLALEKVEALAKEADGVECSCGALWGTGCKADNHGARCNPADASKCWEYAGNCSD